MKQLENRVEIAGLLVSSSWKEGTSKKGQPYLSGELVLRTEDNSEHSVRFMAMKYKKDETGKYTNELSNGYKKFTEELNVHALKGLSDVDETIRESYKAPKVVVSYASFSVNDYKGKDNEVHSAVNVNANSFRAIYPDNKDYDAIECKAKYTVEGVIETIKDEIRKDEATGNLIVVMNIINQRSENGYGKDAKYVADSIAPIVLTVDKSITNAFRNAGYYEGCFTKLVGRLVNTTETVKQVEKMVFGDDVVKEFTNTVRKNVIASGGDVKTIYDVDLTDDMFQTLITKRKQHLAEIKSGVATSDEVPFAGSTVVPNAPTSAMNYNPFAQ